MEKPKSVEQAVTAIWITIGISVVFSLIRKWIGDSSTVLFTVEIMLCGLWCIFPYKISNGSNPTRYVYSIFSLGGYLLLLGNGANDFKKLHWIESVIIFFIHIFILIKLFQKDSSEWFAQKHS